MSDEKDCKRKINNINISVEPEHFPWLVRGGIVEFNVGELTINLVFSDIGYTEMRGAIPQTPFTDPEIFGKIKKSEAHDTTRIREFYKK